MKRPLLTVVLSSIVYFFAGFSTYVISIHMPPLSTLITMIFTVYQTLRSKTVGDMVVGLTTFLLGFIVGVALLQNI